MKSYVFAFLLLAAPAAAQGPFNWTTPDVRIADLYPHKLTLMSRVDGKFEPLVEIDMKEGKATFGPHFTQDEASRVLWQSFARDMPHCDWSK